MFWSEWISNMIYQRRILLHYWKEWSNLYHNFIMIVFILQSVTLHCKPWCLLWESQQQLAFTLLYLCMFHLDYFCLLCNNDGVHRNYILVKNTWLLDEKIPCYSLLPLLISLYCITYGHICIGCIQLYWYNSKHFVIEALQISLKLCLLLNVYFKMLTVNIGFIPETHD